MTLDNWMKDAEKISKSDLKELIGAFETLKTWKTFQDEYGWTGIGTIENILKAELAKRY